MNKIILIGNLTRDPDANTTAGGVNFTRFTIAVNRIYANAAGERVADYFDVIAWRNVGELCAKYLAKGSKVGITKTATASSARASTSSQTKSSSLRRKRPRAPAIRLKTSWRI